MATGLYPLLFTPIYKDYIWGGNAIHRKFGRQMPLSKCAESWEIADRPEGASVIANGPLAGVALGDLVRERRRDLLGPAFPDGPFPLLVKILDARERLSVQVHPDNATAARHGGEPKTETWVVLEAKPGARLYAGLRPGASPTAMRAALAGNTVEELLQLIPVSAGSAIFIPGGRVHAIGEGCLVFEVQQNSNTTYRLYDWDRVGKDGRPRDLHLEPAFRVIRWDDRADPRVQPTPLENTPGLVSERLVACPYFRVDRLRLAGDISLTRDCEGCDILFICSGSVRISAAGQTVVAEPGTTCLLPAACPDCALEPLAGPAQLLRTRPG